jgi:NADH-quinone oxidoreductase subunit N
MEVAIGFVLLGYVLLIALAVLLIAGIASVIHKRNRLQLLISTGALLAITVVSVSMLLSNQSLLVTSLFSIYPFSMYFAALFSISLMMVNLLAYEYAGDYPAFSMLLGFAALGMFSIAMANSLITILLGVELMTLPTAFMIMINGKQYVEAAVKLFILAAISIAVLAFAIALVFPFNLQLSLSSLSSNPSINGNYLAVLALMLFITALAFDASLFPFNLWVPDVYTGAPAYIAAMLSGVNKKVAFAALFEILFVMMFPFSAVFAMVFQVLAIFTMFFGNLAALVQSNVKRLFAYSSISQAGYIALGFVAATQYGIEASLFQIVAHSFMIIGAFAIVL